jgi:hypothetical protein
MNISMKNELAIIDKKWQTPSGRDYAKEYAEGKLGSIDYSIINK